MRIVAVIFAVAGGLLILAGYFVAPLRSLQGVLLGWAMIVAAAATVVGVFNLILVHGGKIQNRVKGAAYSAILLVSLFATFIFGLSLGPDHPALQRLIGSVVIPAESSLMALLAVSLIYACVRLLRHRANLMGVVFLATAVFMLITSATLPFGEVAVLSGFIRPWFQHVAAMGGARGLLLGVALGTIVTGLRVLLAADRPYEAG